MVLCLLESVLIFWVALMHLDVCNLIWHHILRLLNHSETILVTNGALNRVVRVQHFNGAPFLKAFLVSSINLDRLLNQKLRWAHNCDLASIKLLIWCNWLGRLILFDITRDCCLVSLKVAIEIHRAFGEVSVGLTCPYLVLCLAIFSGN